MNQPLIIGSRGSDLALWQSNFIQTELTKIGLVSRIQIIQTKGDQIQHLSFDKIEGKGFFTKEIEEALLNGSIDLAVHSHKDLETTSPEGLTVAAVSHRADPRELLLIHPAAKDDTMPWMLKKGAVVGTSSARRKAQLLHARPDIAIQDIRGNVPTRVQKLREHRYDAILLAKAGIDRLQLQTDGLTALTIEAETFVPAPAQGVLAVQCRSNDKLLIEKLQSINHEHVRQNIHIERQVLSRLKGGCHLPLGVYAIHQDNLFHIEVAFAKTWNEQLLRFHVTGNNDEELISEILFRIEKH